jgi:glutamate synthase domain-containing protein 1
MPDKFLRKRNGEKGVELPPRATTARVWSFFPQDVTAREAAMQVFEHIIRDEGQIFLGWRSVPKAARFSARCRAASSRPSARCSSGKTPPSPIRWSSSASSSSSASGVRYWIRDNEMPNKFKTFTAKSNTFPGAEYHYITNLSARTMIYKGMLTPCQLGAYFPDFHDPDFESALALMHTRFSTNTFPSWSRAHPNRFIAHNGEINTVMGNANFMRAREALCQNPTSSGTPCATSCRSSTRTARTRRASTTRSNSCTWAATTWSTR